MFGPYWNEIQVDMGGNVHSGSGRHGGGGCREVWGALSP